MGKLLIAKLNLPLVVSLYPTFLDALVTRSVFLFYFCPDTVRCWPCCDFIPLLAGLQPLFRIPGTKSGDFTICLFLQCRDSIEALFEERSLLPSPHSHKHSFINGSERKEDVAIVANALCSTAFITYMRRVECMYILHLSNVLQLKYINPFIKGHKQIL